MDFAFYLWVHYRLEVDDVVPTNAPGYWRITAECDGLGGGCVNMVHLTLGNVDPMQHTIRYTDPDRDDRGRWASPYRTWRAHAERCLLTTVGQIRSLRQLEEALR